METVTADVEQCCSETSRLGVSLETTAVPYVLYKTTRSCVGKIAMVPITASNVLKLKLGEKLEKVSRLDSSVSHLLAVK
jgi:hypothetical protein